jgi:acyl-coenzyme A thioesterase 9
MLYLIDLDSLAASVAYKHVLPEGIDMREAAKAGLYVVTAAVDRLDMLRPLSPDEPEDLRLSGHVYSVGRSTMEITVRLQSISRRKGLRDTPETILLGRFTMACRDKETGKAKAVPQLITEGDDEATLEKLGKEQREKKLAQMKQSLQVVPPNEGESKMLHRVFTQFQDYYKEGANVPDEVVWMRKGTQLSSALMAHPQERNVHGNVFVSREHEKNTVVIC